jgi:GWxTD domain-containing protein
VTRRAARNALLVAAGAGLLFLWASLARSAAAPSRKELLAALSEEDLKWLTDYVAPIILPEEEKLFLELTEPHLRERFKREFWARREREGLQPPLGPGYEARYRELRSRADEVYDGWRSDTGQMVLRWGEPANIYPVQDCQYIFRDLEIWTYAGGPLGSKAELGFYRPQLGAPRRLLDRQTRESDIFLPTSCRQTFASLWPDCPESPPMVKLADKCKGPVCSDACTVFHLYQRVLGASGAFQEKLSLFAPAPVPLEGIDKIKTMSATAADPNAKPLAVTGPSATVPVAAPVKPALKKSKKQLLAELPDDERAWLTSFVAPIILKEEENLFLELTEGYQWEIFKKEFWDRREQGSLPPPFGEGFKQRYEELRPRLDSVYDGWRNDAAQLVLHLGEPADIHHVDGCDMVFRDVEIWTYTNLGMARGNVHHLFYRPMPVVPRKLWRETTTRLEKQQGSNSSAYDEIFSPGSCRKRLADLRSDCTPAIGDPCNGPVCFEACDVYRAYQEELSRQGDYLGGISERARLLKLPEISTEGLDRLRQRFATTADPNAKQLSVEGPTSKPRAAPEPTPTPEPLRALTAEEIRDRIVHLEPKYRQFLDLAGPLLTEDELQRFLQMNLKEKDRFIKEFWKRRS